jgi:5'-methylthioadenosine phosphorylase
MTTSQADIGIFGGSGFYEFAAEDIREISVETPYGPPSDTITLATVAGHRVAFLPRHGKHHTLPPHKIPYRANLWALHSLGVRRVLAPAAVGSLQAHIQPGHFVISDQFIDRTTGRDDTFYDGPVVTHVSSAEPYCPQLRALAIGAARDAGVTVHETGTCVVIQGPRFSTQAESRWFTRMGWDTINMTQYPEAILARELALCYVNIALVTDYDAGVVVAADAVQVQDVLAILRQNNVQANQVIRTLLERLPPERDCPCAGALDHARLE